MNKFFYLLLASLFMVLQVRAQQMIVHTNDGSEINFKEVDYGNCKLTFSNGEMRFHVGDAVKKTIEIKSIQRMSFYGLQSNVKILANGTPITYSDASKALVVNGQPGTTMTVYHVNGSRVMSHVQTIAPTEVSVSHLPAGTYVAVVGSETLKFVKR